MTSEKLSVLISGAGLGGLLLACCLEKTEIDYVIYERQDEIRPLGSAIAIGCNCGPVLEQLGLWDKVMEISMGITNSNIMVDKDMSKVSQIRTEFYERMYGYGSQVMSRAALYDMLLERVPKEKIVFGKRVVSAVQDAKGVTVTCSDSSQRRTHIVVGADGAYSTIRANMYKDLASRGKLPKSDQLPLQITHSCLIGTTNPLPTDKYPQVLEPRSYMDMVLGSGKNKDKMFYMFTIPGGKVCWVVLKDYNESQQATLEYQSSISGGGWRNTDEAIEVMKNEVRDFPTSIGYTLGDLIDSTPDKGISRVLLEQKMFETWHDGRIVLLGDACHKMNPAAGQGCMQAFSDATVLASQLFDLESNTTEDISKAFEGYKNQRYHTAHLAVESSKKFNGIFAGRTWFDNTLRRLLLNVLPPVVVENMDRDLHSAKFQLTYLPFVEHKGTVKSKTIVQKQSTLMHRSSNGAEKKKEGSRPGADASPQQSSPVTEMAEASALAQLA